MKMKNNFFQKNKGVSVSKTKRNGRGFTLIEMLVSISLFSIVLVIVLGAMLTIINVNRRAQALASVINNFNASIESMNRVIKSAEPGSIEVDGTYNGGDGNTINLSINNQYGLVGSGMDGIVYVSFRLDEGRIERKIGEQPGVGTWLAVTADDVTIQVLRFIENVEPTQPEVIIIMAGEAGVDADSKTSFELMTTVSQRQVEQ